MKILKLTFENINSLKGKWQIDFDDPAFYGNAVFAITGDTGAGKTSVLDAICLALYSQTPRVAVNAAQNEVMSIGRAQAMSEVVFRVDGKIYRAYWAQHRARKKADGTLQPVIRELSELNHKDDESGKILESKPSLVDKLIEQVLGMTMVQFTRSVMLVQGDFAAFLKANEHERGAILEQLTGTQIYAEIGRAAYQVHKKHEEDIKTLHMRLGEVRILGEDDYTTLKNTLNDHKTAQSQRQHEINQLSDDIDHSSRYQALITDIEHWQAKQVAAVAAIDAFSEDAKRLAVADIARAITPIYQHYQHSCNAHQEKTARLNQDTMQRASLDGVLSALDAKLNKHQAQLDQAEKSYTDAKPLLTQVRVLDKKISLDVQTLDQHKLQHTQLQTRCREATLAKDSTATELQAAKLSLDALSQQMLDSTSYQTAEANQQTISRLLDKLELLAPQYLQQHQETQAMQLKLGELIQDGRRTGANYRTAVQKIAEKQALLSADELTLNQLLDLPAPASDIPDSQASVTARYRQALQDLATRPRRLQDELNQLDKLKAQLEQAEDTQSQLAALTTAKIDAEAQKQALTQTMAQLIVNTKNSEDKLKLLQDNYSLQSQILHMKAHFDQLNTGDACPLCGATEHPAKHNPQHLDGSHAAEVHSELMHAQATLDKLRREEVLHSQSLARLDAQLSTNDTQRAQLQSALAKIGDDIDSLVKILSMNGAPTLDAVKNQQAAILQRLQDSDKLYQNAADELTNWQESQAALLRLQHEKEQLIHQAKTIKATLDSDYQALNLRYTALRQSGQNISTLLDTAEHLGAVNPTHVADWQGLMTALGDALHEALATISLIMKDQKAHAKTALPAEADYQDALSEVAADVQTSLSDYLTHQAKLLHDQQSFAKDKAQYENSISALSSSLTQQIKQLTDLNHQLASSSNAIDAVRSALDTLTNERAALLSTTDVDAHERNLQAAISEARSELQTLQDDAQTQRKQSMALDASITTLTTDVAQLFDAMQQADADWQAALSQAGLIDTDSYLAACLDDDTYQTQKQHAEAHQAELKHSTQMLADYTDKLDKLRAADPDAAVRDVTALKTKLAEQQNTLADLLQKIGEMNARLHSEQENRQYQAELMMQVSQQLKNAAIWEKLNALIGSADGKKYRNFVQGLTLDLVLHHANQILAKMNDRYLLSHDADQGKPLQISVTDTHQGDSVRSSANLSGGESFVISLSLALALSQINSRQVQIESLFLDEGFGTLDEKALDMALNTLFELQQSGKSIGIISHVASLKERIDTQIIIEKRSGGSSILYGAGVHALPDSTKT